MVAVFLVCWGPYAVLSIIGVLGFHKVNLISNSDMQLRHVASFNALLVANYLNFLLHHKGTYMQT